MSEIKHINEDREKLTRCQWRIVRAIADGRATDEVAYHLGNSKQTIYNTLGKIYDKLLIPHTTSALTRWYCCYINVEEIPQYMLEYRDRAMRVRDREEREYYKPYQRIGATLLTTLIIINLLSNNDMIRNSRRSRRRNETEQAYGC